MLPEVRRCLKREALAGGTVVHVGAGAGCLTQGCSSNSNWHAHSSLAVWATKAKLNIASAAAYPLYLSSHYIKERCHLWAGRGEGQVSNTEKSLQLGVINPVYKLRATETSSTFDPTPSLSFCLRWDRCWAPNLNSLLRWQWHSCNLRSHQHDTGSSLQYLLNSMETFQRASASFGLLPRWHCMSFFFLQASQYQAVKSVI